MEGKLKRIAAGWFNVMFKDPRTEELAIKRAKECADCEEAVESDTLSYAVEEKGETKVIQGLVCGQCNCPLSAKTRSPQEWCPIDKW
jgi:hypothetical protein